jgi:hypothetical protein
VKRQWRITERDLDVLEFLTRYGAATAEQVRREFFGDSIKAAYRRLKSLEERGMIKGERVFYKMPGVYRVTEPGARLAQVDLPPPRRDLARLHHVLEVVELSWALRSGELHHGEPRLGEGVEDWITEREIRRDKLIERREKESGRMKKGGLMGRTPDGLMILEDGSEIAVELELTPKRGASYRKIFSDYERQLGEGELDGVRFYFASQKALKRASELAGRHDLLEDGAAQFLHYSPVLEHRR